MDEGVGEGLSGCSFSSRFFDLIVDRKIFFRPARVRRFVGDLGGVFGIVNSDTGGLGEYTDRGVDGGGNASGGNLYTGKYAPGDVE